ncbi:MAG: DUF2271 domain-containing protein [Spirochaetota bacterium]
MARFIAALAVLTLIAASPDSQTSATKRDGGGTPSRIEPSGPLVMSVTFDAVKPHKGVYLWVTLDGKYVATIQQYGGRRKNGSRYGQDRPNAWAKSAGSLDALDGISGATPHETTFSTAWNCCDKDGKKISPGTYVVWMEFTLHSTNKGPNPLYSNEIVIGDIASETAITPGAHVVDGKIVFNPAVE